MKTTKHAVLLGLLACVGVWAQSSGSSIRVQTSLPGARFIVDGRVYDTPQVFFWPEGSKHTLQVPYSVDVNGLDLPYQFADSGRARYQFRAWKTNGPPLIPNDVPVQVVTASPSVTELTAQLDLEYKILLQFYGSAQAEPEAPFVLQCFAPGDAPQDYLRTGIVYFGSRECYSVTTEIWRKAGATLPINAFPFPGFVFNGWIVNGVPRDPAYLRTYVVDGTATIIPNFQPAKRVRFASDPPGLQMLVDTSVIQLPRNPPLDQWQQINKDLENCTPDIARIPGDAPPGIKPLCVGDFDFFPGSTHRIGAPQAQQDIQGQWWVFAGFSNGMGNNALYTTNVAVNQVDAIIAKFVPGVPAAILSNPAGLKMEIDGRSNWPGPTFMWGAGETHTVTAPPTVSDSKGRKYTFLKWSNNGTATQEVVVPNDRNGMTLTAQYQILGQVQLTTLPPGLQVTVDGTQCQTPCTIDRPSGAQVLVAAAPTQVTTPLSRLEFVNWSNSNNSTALTLTFGTDLQPLQANYRTSHLLTAVSDPPNQVNFKYSPASPDGYFAEGSTVTVTAEPKGGYKFRRWEGALSGQFATGYVNMAGPMDVIARLDKIPFIPPAGVKNAAGDTPDGSVAPGSIVAIYGENLAETLEVGPVNPLSQALSNITVTVNDRLLPLLFVSPRQINAQVPSDLADGSYTLKVNPISGVAIPAKFTVRRNAPALYTSPDEQGTPWALALHEDGTQITRGSPARRNETVSLYGNGFGPYDRRVIDGFIVPDAAVYKLLDSVALQAGDVTLTPQWAGAAPGFVGTNLVRLKIGEEIPREATLDVTVSVNGATSNRVQLPVE